MNFGDLKADVASAIIDTPDEVIAKIPGFIVQAVKDLQDRHGFKVCETQTSVMTTSVGLRTLAVVPSDLARYRKLPVSLEPIDGRTRELAFTHDRDAAERQFGTDAGGEALTDSIEGRPELILHGEPNDMGVSSWEVYPLPDGLSIYANGEYRIRIPYYRYLPTLSADGDENWLTNNAHQFIIQQAVSYGFFEDHDVNNGQVWAARAGTELQKIIDADKKLRLSSVRTLRVSPGARGRRFTYGDR